MHGKLRKSLLSVPNAINIKGPKGIPTPVLIKGKAEIPFLDILWIGILSDPLLPKLPHILSCTATILALNMPIHQGRVLKLVPEPCHYGVIQEPGSLRLLVSRLVRIGTWCGLIGQGTRPCICISQNRSRVIYYKVATAAVIIESLQTLDRYVYYTREIWSADDSEE